MAEFFSGHKETRRPTGERGSGFSQAEPLRWSSRMHGIATPSNPKAIRYSSRNDVNTYYQLLPIFDVAQPTAAQQAEAKKPVRQYWSKNRSSPGGYYQLADLSSIDINEVANINTGLLTKILDAREALLLIKRKGLATSSDIAIFDNLANNYNRLMWDMAWRMKYGGISGGLIFTFVKNSTMGDFDTTCCWTKNYNKDAEKGLSGLQGFKRIRIGSDLSFFPIIIAAAVALFFGDAIMSLFRSTETASLNAKERYIDKLRTTEEKKCGGDTDCLRKVIEKVAQAEEDLNIEAERQRLKKDSIFSKIGGFFGSTVKTAAVTGGLVVGGAIVVGGIVLYYGIKSQQRMQRMTETLVTKAATKVIEHPEIIAAAATGQPALIAATMARK